MNEHGVVLRDAGSEECSKQCLRPSYRIDDDEREAVPRQRVQHVARQRHGVRRQTLWLRERDCRPRQRFWGACEPSDARVVVVRRKIVRHSPDGERAWAIDGGEPRRVKGRRHPKAAARASCLAAERIELRGCRQRRAHQLDLVEDPLCVIVEKREIDWPAGASHAVAPHQGATDEHVLCANDERGTLWVEAPVAHLHVR